MQSNASTIVEAAIEALEACRLEAVRRLSDRRLALSLVVPQIAVVPGDNPGNWKTEQRSARVSGLAAPLAQMLIDDHSVPNRTPGFRVQLESLARKIEAESDPSGPSAPVLSESDGVDALISRCLLPMAVHYLRRLPDLSMPDHALAKQIGSELQSLVEFKDRRISRTTQMAIAGIDVTDRLSYRDVTIRPLSPEERGEALELGASPRLTSLSDSDFVPPQTVRIFFPTTLLSVRTTRSDPYQVKEPALPNKVLLAFFLHGFQLAGAGSYAAYDEPRWASFAISHSPSLLAEHHSTQQRTLSLAEFRDVVDLAHKIPDFGQREGSGKEIVLYRVLRGCGMHWQQSGFLDFAIALEAALLNGVRSELSYRFSLYGALFLRDMRDPRVTYDQLRNVYSVRSALVHGSGVNSTHRQAAERDAADLAIAVLRKSLDRGWPDADVLNRMALERQ